MKQNIAHDEVLVLEPNTNLQELLGSEIITEDLIRKMDKVLSNNDIDFTEEAKSHLKTLKEATIKASEVLESKKTAEYAASIENIIKPIMDLKGQAGMFHFGLISKLADTMMVFLEENVQKLDKDIIQIVAAHHKTLTTVLAKNLRGDGGNMGAVLVAELDTMIARYAKNNA